MTTPTASVIVCVLDDWRVLRLLNALRAQSVERHEFEVIIVKTGTEDYGNLPELYDDLDLKVLHSDVARLPVQRNLGLRAARGEFYLTTDADCVPKFNWIEDVLKAFSSGPPELAAIGGRIEKLKSDTLTRRHGITIDDGQVGLNYLLPISSLPYVTGANSAFRRDVVLALGGYDEDFHCGDDVDLSYRLGLAGKALEAIDGAWIAHEDRPTLAAHFRRFSWYARDQALLFKKHAVPRGARVGTNPYPWTRLRDAVKSVPADLRLVAQGRSGEAGHSIATAVEAAGVLYGDVRGSMTHRVLYI